MREKHKRRINGKKESIMISGRGDNGKKEEPVKLPDRANNVKKEPGICQALCL